MLECFFSGGTSVVTAMEHWYCIYKKPKTEDQVSQCLMNVPDIEVFYPKLKRKKFIGGKLKDAVEELFPCYIFSRFNPVKH
jgi:transcriptional antiterminator RfaH